jgi:uncharacterized protein (DUF488 family)
MPLYTVGHGTRPQEELVAALHDAAIGRLVDVRRFPGSRRNPHFGREALETALPDFGIAYQWWGETLGGRRRAPTGLSRHPAWREPSFGSYADYMDTPTFRDALRSLLDSLPTAPATAVMCAETLWWRCHRRLIADAAELAGVEVVHLIGTGHRQRHALHPAVRAGSDGWPVYDVGVDRPLIR